MNSDWLHTSILHRTVEEKKIMEDAINDLLRKETVSSVRNELQIGCQKWKELKLYLKLKSPRWGLPVYHGIARYTDIGEYTRNFYARMAKQAKKEKWNTFDIGNFIEMKCYARAVALGYQVFLPANDGCSVDAIFRLENNLFKIQVKSVSFNEEKVHMSTTKNVGKYDKDNKYNANEIDAFVSYVPHINKYLWIPISFVGGRTNVTLRILEQLNPNGIEVFYLKDFVWKR